MRKLPLLIGTAILVCSALTVFIMREDTNAATANFTLETTTVERGDVSRIVSASGSVRALTTVEVGTEVSGQIIEMQADFNSEVTQGQIIARIDPQTYETRVLSARADVASAKANLDVQKASIRSAHASLEQIEKDYARQSALYAQDAIALSLLESKDRELAVTRASLQVAEAQLRSSESTLSQRNASLQNALLDLKRTTIRSPIDGVVISRNVDVGQTVQASFSAPTIFMIAQDLGDIRIDASVVEGDIGGINAGDPATFKVDAYPDETFTGIVEQVRLASETIANVVTYTVVIAAENPTGRLLPGMTANVEITAEKRENVLRIADSAARFRPPVNGPEVIEDSTEAAGGERRQRGREGGRGNPVTAALENMDIAPEKRAKIEDAIAAELSQLRTATTGGNIAAQGAGMSGGGGGNTDARTAQRQRLQNAINRIMRENLSSQHYRDYQSAQNTRTNIRQVELYQPAEDNKLSTQQVGVGLSDGTFVEILFGAEDGDVFITRLRAMQATG